MARTEVDTQFSVAEGRPDVIIRSPNYLIYIEVKIKAALGQRQLDRYRSSLQRSDREYTSLVLLSRYPFTNKDAEQPNHAIRWHQIAEWLEEIAQEPLNHPYSQHIILQFVEFLQARNITVQQVRAEVTQAIQAYQQETGGSLHQLGRMRSLRNLLTSASLLPLHNLLMMMGEALAAANIYPTPKFDSGQHNGGWIGYNINRMTFWFFVQYNRPAHLLFDAERCDKVKLPLEIPFGKVMHQTKSIKWRHELDLNEPDIDFFNQSKNKQIRIIENFFRHCYDFAQSITT